MKIFLVVFLFVPFISFGQSSIVQQIDSVITSYAKIKDIDLILLTNTNDKKLERDFGIAYKFRKADKKLLEVNIFLKKEPSYSVYKYYYRNDSFIKVVLHSPKDTFREYYYSNSKFVYTNNPETSKAASVFLKGETIFRLRAYSYLDKNNVQ